MNGGGASQQLQQQKMMKSVSGVFRRKQKIARRAMLSCLALWLVLVFISDFRGSSSSSSNSNSSYYHRWFSRGDDSNRSIILRRHHLAAHHLLEDALPLSSQQHRRNSTENSIERKQGVICDFSHFRTDVCYLNGDVRVKGSRVMLMQQQSPAEQKVVARIKPYTRKWETSCMNTIGEVSVEVSSANASGGTKPVCQVKHSVPAIIFSTGGYTGNVYHEFNDGLIPLFITAEKLQGEVVFMILELHDWWMMKYGSIVANLSKYPVIDFDKSKRVHCFPQVTVGLKIHGELEINSSLMEDGKGMRDFQSIVSSSLGNGSSSSSTALAPQEQLQKPKLLLITRKSSRVLLNRNAVLRAASKMGFQVETLSPNSHTELSEMHRALQAADVVVGVHGAALTHLLFMRPGSVLIQVIPLGTDWPAATYYGEPATKAGLEYIAYRILPEESSLVKKYGRNHTAVTHPEKITEQGWWEMKKIYLQDQDVRLLLPRFRGVLRDALRRVKKTRAAVL